MTNITQVRTTRDLLTPTPDICAHCEAELFTAQNRAALYCLDCDCIFDNCGEVITYGGQCDPNPDETGADAFTVNEVGGCLCITPEPRHEREEVSQPRLLP